MPTTSTVAVTGANGFIGTRLCQVLQQHHYAIRPLTRTHTGDMGTDTHWLQHLSGVQTVIHLAARVHVLHDTVSDPLTSYRATNTLGTLQLAKQAVAAGVRRFIFVSSIKVNGEERATPYTVHDTPSSQDPYGISKWEAEQGLWQIAARTGLEVVILRPPLVYGVGVKANFYRLMSWVERGIPLPFASVQNQRSLLYLDNLVDALRVCVTHPAVANKTFLIADNEALSTPALIRTLASHLERPARLWAMPPALLHHLFTLLGRKAEAQRLLGSLQVDNTLLRETLAWQPPFTADAGLKLTAQAYRQTHDA